MASLVVVLVLVAGSVQPFNFFRYNYFRRPHFPKRDELNYPLPGLLPLDTEELWYGFDEEGYSRL
ncbi:hypothetical protein Hamer_G024242 [Homarus americanus]|uniref:Uncharacterized protein n=1 Tax=Homarus americanus TaxID=6706 RepID=A0A8J5N9Q9_HOMAM|nr:hypothetical protein Hamer_G024242 [Homarus americanus]